MIEESLAGAARLRERLYAEPPQGTRLNDYNRWLNVFEVAEDAIAALERSEEDRAAMQAVVDAAGEVCRLGPAADWQRLDLALLALHRVRKAREGGAA